jgi:hypothetical protein
MFFDSFIDLIWIIIIYGCAYRVWNIFLSKHSNVLKDLFNIDVRYYNYTRESSTNSQHEILYTLSSTTMTICMIISPIIHTIMYMCFFNFFNFVQINRILLTITMVKLLWYADLTNKNYRFRPWTDINELFLTFQLLFIIINYNNTTTIIPVLFQIVDELSNVENILITMSRHYTTLFGGDSALSSNITIVIIFIKTYKRILKMIYMTLLVLILFTSIMYSNLKTFSEIIFYYYAALRIAQLSYVS